MEILGIGPLELFFIVLIALILLGPQDMVKAGRTIGKLLRRTILSPSWLNIQRKVRNLPYELMREAGLEDEELRAGINDIRKMTRVDLGQDLNRSLQQQKYQNPPKNMVVPAEDLPEPPQIPTPPGLPEAESETPVRSYPAPAESDPHPVLDDSSQQEPAVGDPDGNIPQSQKEQ